jgi:AcrR family transcriptional regulator
VTRVTVTEHIHLPSGRQVDAMEDRMVQARAGSNAERSEAARERVLQAALRAVAINGYSGSSLASIAAAAELTTAGLLYHFPSKHELLVAVLAERDRLDGARFQLRGARGLAALDRLEQLVAHNAEHPELVRAFTVLLGESAGDGHPARSWAQERYLRRRENIAAALRSGIVAREIREDVDVDALAAQVIAMMDGLQVQWVLDPEGIDMAALFRHYLDGLRRGIRAQRAEDPTGSELTADSPCGSAP